MPHRSGRARTRVRRGLVAALLGAGLLAPAGAQASGNDVWADCGPFGPGTVSSHHSQADFQDAIENPPADAKEYAGCMEMIRAAQIKAAQGAAASHGAGGGGAGGSGGGGTPAFGAGTGGDASAMLPAVDARALGSALKARGIDAAAPAGSGAGQAPAPSVVDGHRVDLTAARVPTIASALSLPLPLALTALVILLSAAMPIARLLVARLGSGPGGLAG